jgi:hypothetical protein
MIQRTTIGLQTACDEHMLLAWNEPDTVVVKSRTATTARWGSPGQRPRGGKAWDNGDMVGKSGTTAIQWGRPRQQRPGGEGQDSGGAVGVSGAVGCSRRSSRENKGIGCSVSIGLDAFQKTEQGAQWSCHMTKKIKEKKIGFKLANNSIIPV